MSSGEKAKPLSTFEERNPFDISRNSGPQVAAEIAKRMAAWKQARARTNPGSAPNQTDANQSGAIPSGNAKQPPIAAPVQPARMPKAARGSQPAQPSSASGSAGSAEPRAPYFAVSATRRAMPPAPSPKQARPSASRSDERAARANEPLVMPPAPVREQVPRNQDERPLQVERAILAPPPEPPVAEPSPAESAAIEHAPQAASAPVQPESPDMHPFESAAAPSDPAPREPDETERRRAEARALKARWIAARDLDTLLERPAAGAAQPVEAAGIAHDAGRARNIDTGKDAGPSLVREAHGAEEGRVRSSTEEPDSAFEAMADAPALPATPAEPEATAMQTHPLVAWDEAADRQDPTFENPKAPAPEPASVAGREAQALDIAVLDEMAGRREPIFDAPVARPEALDAAREARVEAPGEMVAPLRAEPGAAEAADPTMAPRDADDQRTRGIAALDAMAGRKEPTFDAPLQPAAADRTAEVHDEAARASMAGAAVEPVPALSAQAEAAGELPALNVDALDRAAGREEPTFDKPVRPAVAAPSAAHKAAPRVKLRPIETRIEARRVDTLRADPQMAVRRPIFPHIEPEEWDVPPMVAARVQRERRGTGWAIGLGSVLLIAGITAPAAIWQQGRQVQDQVALTAPAPVTQQPEAGTLETGPTTVQAPAQATLPKAAQAEATSSEAPPPEAPAVAAQQTPQPSSAPPPVEPEPEAAKPGTDQAAADAQPAPKLSAIGDGGDVNEAPIVAPQTPMVNLASKPGSAGTGTPMVARPFVPEQGDGPFLRAPTTGAASVPVAGSDAKPRLIGQLKPRSVASVSRPVASKPVQRKPKPFFQQSPDQMFETLIETLSEGRPVNPNTKPTSPSNRR